MTEQFPILIDSNAPWLATGYGQQAAQLALRAKAAGHDVAIACMTGLNGQPQWWNGILCLPLGFAPYCNDVIGQHARQFFDGRKGLVLALYDAWCIDPAALAGLPVAVWAPVHSKTMSAGDRHFFGASRALPIAMSRHGEKQIRAAGFDPHFVPHGIDCEIFRPLSAEERAEARARLQVPQDCFLVTMVAANKGTDPARKAWAEAFQAFAKFRKKHTDARLFLHTIPNAPYGVDMRPLLEDLGLTDCVHVSDSYAQITGVYTPHYVAALMGASDVLLNPSMGEGFGLPAMEAQACGTPVIVGDNSAQPEYLGAGWKVACQDFWVPSDEAMWALPLVPSITTALQRAYVSARSEEMRARAREFAVQFDADVIFAQYWKPMLDMLAQYAGAAPVTIEPGAVPLPTAESDGLRWIQRGAHTDDWIATGHEEWLAPVMEEMLPEGGVMLDVGAHVGRWALRMARRAKRVIAIEANPSTAAVLRAHCELNRADNVEVIQMAAWDEPTWLDLEDPNQRVNGGSTRVVQRPDFAEHSARGTFAAPLDTVAQIIDLNELDLVKLDVEGADLHALRGMEILLGRLRPKLLIERHDIYGYYAYDDLKNMLTSLGYTFREVNIMLRDGAVAPYLAAEPKPEQEDSPHAGAYR